MASLMPLKLTDVSNFYGLEMFLRNILKIDLLCSNKKNDSKKLKDRMDIHVHMEGCG